MKLKVLLLLLLSFAFSKTSIGNEDEALFLNNNISKASYITVSNAVISVEQLSAYDENFEIIDVSGVLVKVEPDNGYKIVSELRSKLTDSSNYVYLYDTNFGYREDEIVIFEAKDDLAYLRSVRTDGMNYNITSDDVLKKYQQWHSIYGLSLFGAGQDWIEAKVTLNKVNWKQFAKEVFKFCPDVVWQGTGSIEELELEMKNTKTLYCWWD